MDIVKNEGINVGNSVLVSGLTQTEVDKELESHLERYGSINRVLVIDDPKSEYHLCSIVEFANNSAMQTFRPILPIECQSSTDANVTFLVRSLDSVYTSTASRSATKGYLEELQAIADKSGRSFQDVLQEELMKISTGKGVNLPIDTAPDEVSGDAQAASTPALQKLEATTSSPQAMSLPTSENIQFQPAVLTAAPSPSIAANMNAYHQGSLSNNSSVNDDTAATTRSVLTMNDVNPPAVQRVVVEHVMRANEAMSPMHPSVRLRPFSGKIPRPNNELET